MSGETAEVKCWEELVREADKPGAIAGVSVELDLILLQTLAPVNHENENGNGLDNRRENLRGAGGAD